MYYKRILFRKTLVLCVIFCFILSSSIVFGITAEKMNHPPDRPDKPSGPTCGKAGETYTFSAVTNDSDNDKIAYLFDWGDGTTSGWTDFFPSGETASATHSWEKGTYLIRVKAKDTFDAESDWSEPITPDISHIFNKDERPFNNHPDECDFSSFRNQIYDEDFYLMRNRDLENKELIKNHNLKNYKIKPNDLPVFYDPKEQFGPTNTLYVGGSGPENYSKIQDAIDNSSNGDTVFVYNDSSPYEENIVVNKSIKLIGEDRNSTAIKGYWSGHIIYISANWTTISGFTLEEIGYFSFGIYMNSNFSTISGNNIVDQDWWGSWYKGGITLYNSNYNKIIDNKVSVKLSGMDGNVDGICLSASNNNIIACNNISGNLGIYSGNGIEVYNSSNNIITCNLISNNYDGIVFYESNKNNVSNNIIYANGYGITDYKSNELVISNNNFSDNYYGIYIYSAYNNNISGNSFFYDGIRVYYSKYNNVENNTVNNKPLVYLEDKSDKKIMDAGQIILINCENITVENFNFSDTAIGVELWSTNNSKISNNNFLNISYGIFSAYSYNNNISNNKFSNNNRVLYQLFSSGATFNKNTISNGNSGLYLIGSSNNNICNNVLFVRYSGLTFQEYCNNNTISNNIINLDNEPKYSIIDGIWLYDNCDNNIITNNNICLNYSIGSGILITHSNKNIFSKNNFSKIGRTNYGWCFYLISSDYNIISSNYISKTCRGISISSHSIKNIIIMNTIKDSYEDGIYFKQSSNNIITRNIISKNPYGISFYQDSDNNTIYHNDLFYNMENANDECNNIWDNGYPSGGNFWDDYQGEDSDGDGIGDAPYSIPGGNNSDRYPLMVPWGGNKPPKIPEIKGERQFKEGEGGENQYSIYSIDPDEDYVKYQINWSDGSQTETDYYPSGKNFTINVTIPNDKGTYEIFKTKAIDIYGEESEWATLEITVPRVKLRMFTILDWLIVRFPILDRLLSIIKIK